VVSEYYQLDLDEVYSAFDTSKNGLSANNVKRNLHKYGYNELKKEKGVTPLSLFISQFKNALLLLLVFAGILSLALGEKVEAIAIFGILLLNAILGFIQEFRAEKAMEALEKQTALSATVIRDGKAHNIPAKEIVPGDIITLEDGEIVPADVRITECSSLHVDESSLTGESVPSEKSCDLIKSHKVVADQHNMAFMSTIVTYGKGRAVVVGTGMKTEVGKIAKHIQKTEESKTPLQMKFEQLAKQIGLIAIVLIVVVLVLGTLQGALSFGKMLLFALALTVSTIPNSLPIIVTVSLSMGAKRLAEKHMLIKKLPAAESLGAVTAICSDKTGTITKNQMTVTHMYMNNNTYKISGSGYLPEGNFSLNNKKTDAKDVELLLRIGYLCNNAKLNKSKGKYDIIGDPTEGALIVLGKKGKFKEKEFKIIKELPFDSDRKRMSVICKKKKKTQAYVKGAPDLLLEKCNRIIVNGKVKKLRKKDKKKILDMNNKFASQALRVLGFAYKDVKGKKFSVENTEKQLIFVGLTGMIDPPREGIKEAVKKCHDAGIKVMLITGDHAITAKAVAQKVGLFQKGNLVLTGHDLENITDKELEKKINNVAIIARALPIQKSKIVEALKKKGHVVAMTGDGVNDAPALKKADIGIAMGITGTDVAKEVAKSILVDDNFTTIVNAIEEGRNIYDKMIKSAKYLLSCNAGEITSVFLAILLKFPLPILPLQLLLMNLLTDDFPALGLGFEPSEAGIMKRKPRDPKQKPITKRIFVSIVIFGLIMGLGTLFMFNLYREIDLSKAQTVAFTTLVMIQMFAVISSRQLHHSSKHLNPLSNKWLTGAVCLSLALQVLVIYVGPLQSVFGTVALLLMDWVKIIGMAILGLVVFEISKFFLEGTKAVKG